MKGREKARTRWRRAAVVLALVAALAPDAAAAARPTVAFERDGDLWTRGPAGPAVRLTSTPWTESRPAWAPDGLTLAFVSDRRGADGLWLANADGTGLRHVLPAVASAAWAPDGERLAVAWSSGTIGELAVVKRDGTVERRLRTGLPQAWDPAWSPDGRSIAFAGDSGGGSLDVYTLPATGGSPRRLTHDGYGNARPRWSVDGRRITYADAEGRRHSVPSVGGPAGPAPTPTEGDVADVPQGILLPNLDEIAPAGIVVTRANGRDLLGFDASVLNRGPGPLEIQGSRPRPAGPMAVQQVVHLAGGGTALHQGAGILHYEVSKPHVHWHLEPFERYELRRASDLALVGRDHKAGFCLTDRWGHQRVGAGPPVYTGDCASHDPKALSVREGSSVHYVDRYPANFHGQWIDVTAVAPGRYVLVERANPYGHLLETRYDDDAASALIALTRDAKGTHARVLRTCAASATCR